MSDKKHKHKKQHKVTVSSWTTGESRTIEINSHVASSAEDKASVKVAELSSQPALISESPQVLKRETTSDGHVESIRLGNEVNEQGKLVAVETVGQTEGKEDPSAKQSKVKEKPRAEIETFEQFIEYAYSRKGQRLALKPKVEKAIAQSIRLDEVALDRLLRLARADATLAVPRQILLVSQEVSGFPSLRAALTSFVSNVMLAHPVFGDNRIQAALRNLPEALPAEDVMAKLATFEPEREGDAEPLKGPELQELRNNAVRAFATWLAVNRGLNSEELASLLFQVIWQPAAKDLADDSARLRALTDVGQAAGVGLACQRFRQQAIEARGLQDHALREATSLRDRLSSVEADLVATGEELEAVRAELQALRESTSTELEALRRQHVVDRTHLQHDLGQLRGRLVKRLTDSVEMLEVGLSALRKDSPRVPVMVERAEHVVDALRTEITELREE